jgi:hypothetical protein
MYSTTSAPTADREQLLYLDTSAFLKILVEEEHSLALRAALADVTFGHRRCSPLKRIVQPFGSASIAKMSTCAWLQ